MTSSRRGFLFALAAFTLWGFFPLYFKLLQPAGPIEILAHRIVWSVAFTALLLLIVRQWRFLRELPRQPRRLLGLVAAAVLIGGNWSMFLYGVNTDRVVEVSLGYFITPLVTMLLGVGVLRERLRGWQWAAMATCAVAVTLLTFDYGRLPYVALVLAASFGLYGLVKKTLRMPAVEGLFVEATLLALPAIGFLWWLSARDEAVVGTVNVAHTMLVVGCGAVTAIPLLLFAGAANRIPLSALGILQYIAPLMQFGLGVFVFREPMSPARWAGFALVWLALVVFTTSAISNARGRASRLAIGAAPPGPAVEPTRR